MRFGVISFLSRLICKKREYSSMTEMMPLSDRLRLVANVSDLMLAGSIQAYRPETLHESAAIVHDYRRNDYRLAA
jgi:hypothetical protein